MKKLIFLLIALILAVRNYAQDTLVVTLTHGERISAYYGEDGLIEAIDDAASGDVINLSGGKFYFPSRVNKAVSIRGNGWRNTELYPYSLKPEHYIGGDCDFIIDIPSSESNYFKLEGLSIYGQYNNSYDHSSYLCITNATKTSITHCRVTSAWVSDSTCTSIVNCYLEYFSASENSKLFLANCIVNRLNNNRTESTDNFNAYFTNCYFNTRHSIRPGLIDEDNCSNMGNSLFMNCILYYEFQGDDESHNTLTSSGSLPSTSYAENCVALGYKTSPFTVQTNCTTASHEDLFADYSGSIVLIDEAKTKYLGTDGKEVGVYGGFFPYTLTPSYPLITKISAPLTTTDEGILKMEVEVSNGQ